MDSSPLSSAPPTPTDPLGAPLPLPTTLGSHVIGPRYLRSATRSSRSSRTASTVSSRSSSRARRSEGISSLESLSSLESVTMDQLAGDSLASIPLEYPSGSNSEAGAAVPSNARSLVDRVLTPPVQRSRRRRRGYSIHDEIDAPAQDVPVQLSTSEHSSVNPTLDDTRPPTKKRRITHAKKATKRKSSRNSTTNPEKAEVDPSILPSTQTRDPSSSELDVIVRLPDVNIEDESTEVKIEAPSPPPPIAPTSNTPAVPPIPSEPLSEYSCPICFSPPTNATLTPCGHVCCGECLFTAVRSTMQRAMANMGYPREPVVARCPVCRATLTGWDGRGGGIIGLKSRTVISL